VHRTSTEKHQKTFYTFNKITPYTQKVCINDWLKEAEPLSVYVSNLSVTVFQCYKRYTFWVFHHICWSTLSSDVKILLLHHFPYPFPSSFWHLLCNWLHKVSSFPPVFGVPASFLHSGAEGNYSWLNADLQCRPHIFNLNHFFHQSVHLFQIFCLPLIFQGIQTGCQVHPAS